MYTQFLPGQVSSQPAFAAPHGADCSEFNRPRDQQTNNNVRDLEHWISRMPEYARGQLISWLFGAFAALALILAAVGLYSVVSYTVVQRTNEFGIRLALGARPGHVLGIVFRSTLISVGGGIVAGVILTVALNKVMASWAAESSRDPLLLFAATCVLGTGCRDRLGHSRMASCRRQSNDGDSIRVKTRPARSRSRRLIAARCADRPAARPSAHR